MEFTKGPNITKEEFEKLPRVRVFSESGPCITGTYRLWRKNQKTNTLVFWNGDHPAYVRKYSFLIHTEPCSCCPGGIMYPHGC